MFDRIDGQYVFTVAFGSGSAVVIHGGLDDLPTSPLTPAEEMASLIPEAKLIVIPDTGHVPTLTRPEAVVDGINQLL